MKTKQRPREVDTLLHKIQSSSYICSTSNCHFVQRKLRNDMLVMKVKTKEIIAV